MTDEAAPDDYEVEAGDPGVEPLETAEQARASLTRVPL